MIFEYLSEGAVSVRGMRSFEFAGGSSAKFWEISRDGCEVTVRFGRVGAQGQTSVKALADAAVAAAHETKLIGEKLRKGYVETTGSSPSPAAPAAVAAGAVTAEPAAGPVGVVSPAGVVSGAVVPTAAQVVAGGGGAGALDEDAFVLPAGWGRVRTPRRGSAGVGRFTPHPKARAAAEAELARSPERTRAVLAAPTTAETTRADGLAWLDGAADATPLGAAAVAATADYGHWQSSDWANCFADMWIRERGPAFAAEAAVTLTTLIVLDDDSLSPTRQQPGVRFRREALGERRPPRQPCGAMRALLRVRQALATVPAPVYAQVVDALRPYREVGLYACAAVSVLFPEERAWFEQVRGEVVADGDPYLGTLLLTAAGTADDVTALAPIGVRAAFINSTNLLVTMVDGLGAAAAPLLFTWFDDLYDLADDQRRLLSALAVLPTDEVTHGLIERIDKKYVKQAFLEHAGLFPARALRLLAEGAVTDLFRGHLLKHRDLVGLVVPRLSAEAAALVEQTLAEAATVATAPLSAVPPVLADPPWRHLPEPAKPAVITGLTCDDPTTFAWLPGEREKWAALPFQRYANDREWDPEARRQAVLANQLPMRDAFLFFVDTAEEEARRTLLEWRPYDPWMAGTYMRMITARFGNDALPALLSLAPRSPVDVAPALQPFSSPAIAVLMANWLARLKGVRDDALAWLLRHPAEAARALIPPALGKPGPARRQAEGALIALHANGRAEEVRAAARGYGDPVEAAVEALFAEAPPEIPAVPVWATPGVLRPIPLRDGSGSLPDTATENLFVLLALSPLGVPSKDLVSVREACEPAALAAFAWSLFELWQASGSPWKERWAFEALGHLGDDDTVRRLSPLILAWPGDNGHNKSVVGLQVLAAIGTDVALMHLHDIAQRSKFAGLKHAAEQTMGVVGAAIGLTAEQLADRLVPDFGLDADGSVRLDYGPRQFVVGFDEALRPFVTDPNGKSLKTLPKPGVRDDALLAPAAYQRFTVLKKDVRTVAADQMRRLEQAMVTKRRWSGAEFRSLFVEHPLLRHLARRLVWVRFAPTQPGVAAPPGAASPDAASPDAASPAGFPTSAGAPESVVIGSFRVAEDCTFSTVDDEVTTLPDDAVVGIAHPLHLGDDVAAWAAVFADYEILQPFDQLGRPVFTLTEEESRNSRLARFEGAKVQTGRLLGMERKGWRRETPKDAGFQGSIFHTTGSGHDLVIEFEPGFSIGYIDMAEEQELIGVFLHDGSSIRGWRRDDEGYLPLADLDRVTTSEALRDLTDLVGA